MPADVWLPSGWKNHEARSATQQLRLGWWTGAVRQEPPGHRESRGRGWLRPHRGGRPPVAAPDHGRPRSRRTRMLHDARVPGGEYGADKAHGDGVWGALPPSCCPCKGCQHPGCALRRACFGVGSGHYEEETQGLGIPFPPQKERFEMLEETVRIALRMWSGERGDERPFEGKHYRLGRPLNLPQSISRPHPPLMIAGDGEKKTLRLVARYADACSLRPGPQVPGKLAVLLRHCEEEGRDYEEIEKTCAFSFDLGERGEKVEELIGQLRWLSGMGIETVIGSVPGVDRITPLEIIGREVIPAVADL